MIYAGIAAGVLFFVLWVRSNYLKDKQHDCYKAFAPGAQGEVVLSVCAEAGVWRLDAYGDTNVGRLEKSSENLLAALDIARRRAEIRGDFLAVEQIVDLSAALAIDLSSVEHQ